MRPASRSSAGRPATTPADGTLASARADLHQDGRRPRLIYRIYLDRGSANGRRKGFTETDYALLRELIAARLWLTVYQLPPYAPELNLVEGMWSHLKGRWPTSPNTASISSPRW
ncbi:transposase [Streptomyces sp. NPDC048419]|uniref:transposase n=1 Tax=Streptomyces sp. NPDC048419 TaxID=3365547 RepID=UPI003717A696